MTYNIDIINLCIYHYSLKTKLTKISSILNISKQTIYKWIFLYKNYFDNNEYLTEISYKNIKNSKIHGLNKIHLYESCICEYINNNEGSTLIDIIKNIQHINISKSSIVRILKKNNYTYKKINNKIIPYDVEILNNNRKNYVDKLNLETFNEIICIDESSFCVTDHNRYGYSKSGIEIKKIFKHKKVKERRSLLAAINNINIIDYQILDGSIKKDIYIDFFIKNKDVFYNKCILHDNARIHHSNDLKTYCINNNIHLLYLPPYTPEFNPIEEVFAELKIIYRKLAHTNLNEDIELTINHLNNTNINKYYKHSIETMIKYKN